MSKNLQIVDRTNGFNCAIKYSPLNKGVKDKLKVAYKAPDGSMVKLTTVGQDRKVTQTFKAYLDDKSNEYAKAQLIAVDDATGEELEEYEGTSIFDIVKYESEDNYLDKYIVEKYYELEPSDNGKTKDIDRQIAKELNLVEMKKLYDHLKNNGLVAKAEFIVTSGHYQPGAGYVRAITIDGGLWTLELGSFKEEKVFKHLHEPKISVTKVAVRSGNKKANTLI